MNSRNDGTYSVKCVDLIVIKDLNTVVVLLVASEGNTHNVPFLVTI